MTSMYQLIRIHQVGSSETPLYWFFSKMGLQWACIDTSECTGGLNTHCTPP